MQLFYCWTDHEQCRCKFSSPKNCGPSQKKERERETEEREKKKERIDWVQIQHNSGNNNNKRTNAGTAAELCSSLQFSAVATKSCWRPTGNWNCAAAFYARRSSRRTRRSCVSPAVKPVRYVTACAVYLYGDPIKRSECLVQLLLYLSLNGPNK